jgi:hypothetical protein
VIRIMMLGCFILLMPCSRCISCQELSRCRVLPSLPDFLGPSGEEKTRKHTSKKSKTGSICKVLCDVNIP